MKKIIFMCMLLLISSNAFAEDTTELCTQYSTLASQIMGYRQDGNSFSSIYAIVPKDYQSIVIMAYEEPRYYTKEMQDRAKVEFGNTFMLTCIKRFNSK